MTSFEDSCKISINLHGQFLRSEKMELKFMKHAFYQSLKPILFKRISYSGHQKPKTYINSSAMIYLVCNKYSHLEDTAVRFNNLSKTQLDPWTWAPWHEEEHTLQFVEPWKPALRIFMQKETLRPTFFSPTANWQINSIEVSLIGGRKKLPSVTNAR